MSDTLKGRKGVPTVRIYCDGTISINCCVPIPKEHEMQILKQMERRTIELKKCIEGVILSE